MSNEYAPSDDYVIKEENLPLIESLCNDMPGGFFIYYAEPPQDIIFINKAMLRIFACDTEEEFRELTGNSFKGLVHPDDYDRVQDSIEKQIANSPYSLDYVEYRITRRDGSVRWIEDYGKYISTEKGNIFYVFVEDATERMRNRMDELERINTQLKDIHSRESQYHKAILHDAVTFFEVNLSKDEFIPTKIQNAENGVTDLFDFMEVPHFNVFSEFVNCWTERMNQKELEDYRTFFSIGRLISCYEKGEPTQMFEAPYTLRSGKTKFMQFMILIGKNESTGDMIALTVIKDITESNAKQRLFQTALSEANVENIEKQLVLSKIASDVRNPLNSIISYTDMIGYNLSNANILKYCLEKIRASGNKLLEIVSGSMEAPHSKAEMTILGVSECDLKDLLKDIRRRTAPEVSKKQINFSVDSSGVDSFEIYVNTVQLEELLWQLIDNAVKYTDNGGAVTLRVSESSDAPKGFGAYRFDVIDNGAGISSEHLERIRNRSFDSGEGHGSALGLAVVNNITEMMKGSMTVESEEGKGSTFTVTFTFPHKSFRASGESSDGVAVDPMSTVGKHILIVEDDEITREMEQALLESCGYIVDTAVNGKQALKKIEAENAVRYDVILMDIQMPVMNGYETAHAIRRLEDPSIAKVPIIAISAQAFDEEREKAFKFGINEHLSKPINILELQSTIARMINAE